jgi:large subunit ribosomal protein L25
MQEDFVINAEPRVVQGTGASRRLRRAGRLPAIVYGGSKAPEMISLDHNELWKHLKHEAFYSHILTLKIGSESEQVVLKDLHRHPVKDVVLHADLQRVQADVPIRIRVPIHFLNQETCVGVKTGGGMLEHLVNEVEVECLPRDLPEFIELDVQTLGLGESVHLSQLELPAGVQSVELAHGNDPSIVTVYVPRGSAADAGDEAEGAEGTEG